jgi:hypothetical protein
VSPRLSKSQVSQHVRRLVLEAYFTETVRRFAEDVELEGDLVAEAKAGIADIEEGRHRLVETREDLAEMEKAVMDRVRPARYRQRLMAWRFAGRAEDRIDEVVMEGAQRWGTKTAACYNRLNHCPNFRDHLSKGTAASSGVMRVPL